MRTIHKKTTAAKVLTLAVGGMLAASLATAPAAHASCFDQYVFTGVDGHVFDIPGGNVVGVWHTNYKINVHSIWNSAWFGGNVYTPSNSPVATGYVLRQYTRYNATYCS